MGSALALNRAQPSTLRARLAQLSLTLWKVGLAGQRVSALRFGDPRVQALFRALCHFSHLPTGFRNRDHRPLVAALLGRELASHTAGAMTTTSVAFAGMASSGVPHGRCATPSLPMACEPCSCTPRCTAVCGDHTATTALILRFDPVSTSHSTNSTSLSPGTVGLSTSSRLNLTPPVATRSLKSRQVREGHLAQCADLGVVELGPGTQQGLKSPVGRCYLVV